jgi:hypothetical protein
MMEKIETNDVDLINAFVVQLTAQLNEQTSNAALNKAQFVLTEQRLQAARKRIAELEQQVDALTPKDTDAEAKQPGV